MKYFDRLIFDRIIRKMIRERNKIKDKREPYNCFNNVYLEGLTTGIDLVLKEFDRVYGLECYRPVSFYPGSSNIVDKFDPKDKHER